MSTWWRGRYLVAPAISGSVLLLGGAYVHGSEMLARGAFDVAKDGADLLLDFGVPMTMIALAVAHIRRGNTQKREPFGRQ